MSFSLCLDLIIPGAIAFQFPVNGQGSTIENGHLHWTQEAAQIAEWAKDASKIIVSLDDQSWITKTIAIPQSFRAVSSELSVFEMGASLSPSPDDFHYVTLRLPAHFAGDYQIVAAIRRLRVIHQLSSLIPADRINDITIVPRSAALTSGWIQSQRAPRPSLLATQHHGIGCIALIDEGELLFTSSLRIRAPRANQFPAAAGLELTAMISNWKRTPSMPARVIQALADIGRIVCFGDVDTDLVRSELVSRLNLVVESGSAAIYPPLPVPMRLRDSWCVAQGLRDLPETSSAATETILVREGNR